MPFTRTFLLAALLAALLPAAPAPAAPGGTPPSKLDKTKRQANQETADKAYTENQARHKGNADMLVLPGLLADRKERKVTIWAEATGILPDGYPPEFFLIPTQSGRDYEALAVSFARPSDVHRALEFIGLTPGRPVNTARHQFWPKGPRVAMTFHWEQPGKDGGKPKPVSAGAEEMMILTETGKPLPASGFLFTGSYWLEEKDEQGRRQYAADRSDSCSIASNFNDPTTVLDLPRQGEKGVVYGSMKINPAYALELCQPLTVTLEPAFRDDKPHLCDLALTAVLPAGADGARLKDAQFTLQDDKGVKLVEGKTLLHVVAALETLLTAKVDVYLTAAPDPKMTLAAVRQMCAVLGALETEKGVRLEPAPAGHLYFKAFAPSEEWRDRAARLAQPFELHLSVDREGKPKALLQHLVENWDVPKPPKIEEHNFEPSTPEALAQIMKEKRRKPPYAVYVFAAGETPYGQVTQWLKDLLPERPNVFVFLPAGEGAQPK